MPSRLAPHSLPLAVFGVGLAAAVFTTLGDQNPTLARARIAAALTLALAGVAGWRAVTGGGWRWAWGFAWAADAAHINFTLQSCHTNLGDYTASLGPGLTSLQLAVLVSWPTALLSRRRAAGLSLAVAAALLIQLCVTRIACPEGPAG